MDQSAPIEVLRSVLLNRLGSEIPISDDAELITLGIVDSMTLLDILMETEGALGKSFDPTNIDPDGAITLEKLSRAFV